MIKAAFKPDWVSPPGATITDMLEERDWKQSDLSTRLGYSTKHVSRLINGIVPLTEDAAVRLERTLGGSTSFWLNREAQYRAQLAEQEASKNLLSWVEWSKHLPVKELMDFGAIPKSHQVDANRPALVQELLRFFGVASPDEWKAQYQTMELSYRRTRDAQSDVGAISAWLRMGEIFAEQVDAPPFNRAVFQGAIDQIRALTTSAPEDFQPHMTRLCHEAGVALVLVPAIPRAHVSGVARWLNPHRALIQLSLYGKSNDRFWFTFFHEAAHILLHGKSKADVFLDEFNSGKVIKSKQEDEANAWAAEKLIPSKYATNLSQLRTRAEVIAFAKAISIHPGIIVGRMQHEGIVGYGSALNNLKETYEFEGQ